MAKTREDILVGTRASIDTFGWNEVVRIVYVTELTSGQPFLTAMEEAINAVGVAITDTHPDVPSGENPTYLWAIDGEAIDATQIKLTLTYKHAESFYIAGIENNTIEVGSSVIQEETNKDNNGDEMFVTYNSDDQGHMATILYPQFTWSVNQREIWTKSYIKTRAKTYVGRVNSDVFDGLAARTVLCMRIHSRSTDGGVTWSTQFEYQYRPETWDHVAVYIKEDGKPPSVTDGDSEKTYSVQKVVSFASLPTG